jgi:hypothetical protein
MVHTRDMCGCPHRGGCFLVVWNIKFKLTHYPILGKRSDNYIPHRMTARAKAA